MKQDQQQERGAQHAGLATPCVCVGGGGAGWKRRHQLQQHPGPAGGQAALSLAGQPLPEAKERGRQAEGLTPEPLPKACQELRAPLQQDLWLLGSGIPLQCLLGIRQFTIKPTLPSPKHASVSLLM